MGKSKPLYPLWAGFVTVALLCGQDTAAETTRIDTTYYSEMWESSPDFPKLHNTDPVHIRDIIDGDTVTLDNGLQVRLVGIQAPKLPLGRRNFPVWPLARDAADLLQTLAKGQTVTPYFGQTRMDRHGRLLAHLVRNDGVWLQGNLLRAGLARVYSFPDNTRLVRHMLAIERRARQAKQGIWALPHYGIRDATQINWPRGTGFELVQGHVKKVSNVRGAHYLNFGQDWRTDFTVKIPTRWHHTFQKAGIDPVSYTGKQILVRGWVKQRDGLMITVTHPEQIEIDQR